MKVVPWVIAVTLVGCTIQVPTSHLVMFNGFGAPLDPKGNLDNKHLPYIPFVTYPQFENEKYEAHIERIIEGLRRYKLDEKSKKRKILVFVHGGLNTATESIKRAEILTPLIMRDGYYPLFINWESSFATSYFDHLFNIRQGRLVFQWCCNDPSVAETAKSVAAAIVGTATMPFYLVTDIARGILRAPVVWYSLAFRRGQAFALEAPAKQQSESFKQLYSERLYSLTREKKEHGHDGAFSISEGEDRRRRFERFHAILAYLAPTKPLLSIAIDAGGKNAWENMLRRTRTLFHTDSEFSTPKPDTKPSGGLYRFLRRLHDMVKETGDQSALEFTLVGHSMGTIIVNEIIREFGDLPIKNVVYLAAACSVRDYQDTVFQYLAPDMRRQVQVYHLTLHTMAEENELNLAGLSIDGSLLVWIDEFLASPLTPLDLVAGRYTNLITSLHNTPDKIKEQIHIKAFSVGKSMRGSDPQEHGDFDNYFFWQPSFWNPAGHP